MECLPSTEALPVGGLLCKYSKLCVLSPLLFIILSKYFNLCTEAPQVAFWFAYGRYPAAVHLSVFQPQWHLLACAFSFYFDNRITQSICKLIVEEVEIMTVQTDWELFKLYFITSSAPQGLKVVTMENKMILHIHSSYWIFSVQIILFRVDDLYFMFLPDGFL